jgi:hypothetical protein
MLATLVLKSEKDVHSLQFILFLFSSLSNISCKGIGIIYDSVFVLIVYLSIYLSYLSIYLFIYISIPVAPTWNMGETLRFTSVS